jgi:hypothetical protein
LVSGSVDDAQAHGISARKDQLGPERLAHRIGEVGI